MPPNVQTLFFAMKIRNYFRIGWRSVLTDAFSFPEMEFVLDIESHVIPNPPLNLAMGSCFTYQRKEPREKNHLKILNALLKKEL